MSNSAPRLTRAEYRALRRLKETLKSFQSSPTENNQDKSRQRPVETVRSNVK